MTKLAPIGLSVYNRIDKIKITIQSLQNNILAKDSELYIFSDGPKRGDECKVKYVRNYLHSIKGFKQIRIFERENNDRIYNNRNGIKYLLDTYGKIIILEEDVESSPGFLTFMNSALEFYEFNEKVFSITGYSPPLNSKKLLMKDFFVLQRFSAWGCAIWKNRYENIHYISEATYNQFLKNKKAIYNFRYYCGEDVLYLLEDEVKRKIDALDVKAIFSQFNSNQITIYPKNSLTRNIGFDGTGLHCGTTNKYNVPLSHQTKFTFDKDLSFNKNIIRCAQKFFRYNLKTRLKYFLTKNNTFKRIKEFTR